jgi:hypothetical protein
LTAMKVSCLKHVMMSIWSTTICFSQVKCGDGSRLRGKVAFARWRFDSTFLHWVPSCDYVCAQIWSVAPTNSQCVTENSAVQGTSGLVPQQSWWTLSSNYHVISSRQLHYSHHPSRNRSQNPTSGPCIVLMSGAESSRLSPPVNEHSVDILVV